MAIPFLNMTCQQRSKGANALAKAAYNSCSTMKVDAEELDYSRKTGLVFSELITDTPTNRQDFWESVEKSEKRKDATVSREIIAALPIELTREQRQELARTFAMEIKKTFNLPAIDLNIHEPVKRKKKAKAEENPHIHLQFPDRNAEGKKIREFSNRNTVIKIRKLWEDICNQALEKTGIRIDMRTLEEQIAEQETQLAKIEADIDQQKQELTKLRENKTHGHQVDAQRNQHTRRTSSHAGRTSAEAIQPITNTGGAPGELHHLDAGTIQRNIQRAEEPVQRSRIARRSASPARNTKQVNGDRPRPDHGLEQYLSERPGRAIASRIMALLYTRAIQAYKQLHKEIRHARNNPEFNHSCPSHTEEAYRPPHP